jgi:hypothetical protein
VLFRKPVNVIAEAFIRLLPEGPRSFQGECTSPGSSLQRPRPGLPSHGSVLAEGARARLGQSRRERGGGSE